MADIECMRVGTRVKIAEGISGLITCIAIRGQRVVTYEVSWWSGRDQRVEWFQSWQVSQTDDMTSIKIGFQ